MSGQTGQTLIEIRSVHPTLIDADGSARFSRVTGQSPQLQLINKRLDQPTGSAGNPHELRYFSESGKGWLFVLTAYRGTEQDKCTQNADLFFIQR